MTRDSAIAEVIHYAELDLLRIRNELTGAFKGEPPIDITHCITIKDSVIHPLEIKEQWKHIVPALQIKRGEIEDLYARKTYLRDLILSRRKDGPHTILCFTATLQLIK